MSTTVVRSPRHRQPVARPPRGRMHRPLLVMVTAMAALALVCLAGMLVDDRVLLGESVWRKPFKFAVAFAVYGLTLAWLLALPHRGRRITWWLGTLFAVTGIVDVGFIALQAARGTFSHFNTADDPVNVVGQMVFTSGVPGLFLASLLIGAVIARQRPADLPTTRAIHGGLALAVTGMALAYTMGFTGGRRVRDADGEIVELSAGHTVHDGTDGNAALDAGLPLTGWSTVGGDLRIPHFVGLHGIQVLLATVLVLGLLARRRPWLRPQRVRARLVGVVALGYAGLLGLVFWQAMRAQPLLRPDAWTLLAAGALTAAVAAGVAAVRAGARVDAAVRADAAVQVSAAVRPRG
ncbi:hypothetical protein [Nocardia farcinica]|uniref:hypothetical protein n=1 Tax=Nocardia farcinica TaxID=37329 RepID=UPI0024552412|nr:hypothetical protein [Nocardia farcinica]